MLLVLLQGSCLGVEFTRAPTASLTQAPSLLQVSQVPALQGTQSNINPQVAPQELTGAQSALAPDGLHNVYKSDYNPSALTVAPLSIGATATASPLPVATAPTSLAATSSTRKSTQASQMDETALAFSQLSSLDTEFKELHADDESHVRQLTYNVHLREQLREKLQKAQEQLAQDNEQLAERTMQIASKSEGVAPSHGDNAQAPAQPAENGANETFAALLLEAAVVSRRNRELNNAQIATQALNRVKALLDDVSALRARDDEELKALHANAQSRDALNQKIVERSDQLQQDTTMLQTDLGQIRDLVSKDSSSSASDAAPTAPTEEPAQKA